MSEEYQGYIGWMIRSLGRGLEPFVSQVLKSHVGVDQSWTMLLVEVDRRNGAPARIYSESDPAVLLRVLTIRLGVVGYPFDGHLSRKGKNLAQELRETRNSWAHGGDFNAQATYRALDSAALLLEEINSRELAQAMHARMFTLIPAIRPAAEPEQVPTETESLPAAIAESDAGGPEATNVEVLPDIDSAVEIDVTALPYFSYALAYCSVPVLEAITIRNSGIDLLGASVEVEITTADGLLTTPKVHFVDIAQGASATLSNLEVGIDSARMLELEETTQATLRVVLRDAGENIVTTHATELQVLASNFWLGSPIQLAMEVLASFVQPNATAVQSVLSEAAGESATGPARLLGYQSGLPEDVDAQVAAIYGAIRQRDIRYINPPASWGQGGQRIRTPGEVLEGRLGTCLDTTLLLAATLEFIGINSTVWMVEGHSFLGYWRDDLTTGIVAQTDAASLLNHVELGDIAIVETTAIMGGASSSSFAQARQHALERLRRNGESDILGVTDIRAARENGVLPLPSRSISADGTVHVSVYEQPQSPVAPAAEEKVDGNQRRRSIDEPQRVTQWKNALLDLSLRNKLLHYTDRAGYELIAPAELLESVEDVLNDGREIELTARDDFDHIHKERGSQTARDLPAGQLVQDFEGRRSVPIDIPEEAYSTKLRALAFRAKTIREETGANNLYVALGMLKWELNGRELRSPLVLVPVHLTTRNKARTFQLSLDDTGSSTPNFCLLEKLRNEFGLSIPGLAEPMEDLSGIDLGAAFESVRRALLEANLPFTVEDSASLAILQFAKFRLWKDLNDHWRELAENRLVNHMIHGSNAAFSDAIAEGMDADLDELGLKCPIPADASQLAAVDAGVRGKTFVLEGPPGTGKSQTITNLLARCLAEGKRVLFVAEKRAALDIVKKRLDEIGLGDLCLDLHDKNARLSAVRAQLKRSLELQAAPEDGEFMMLQDSGITSSGRLSSYASRLHEKNPADFSLYNAVGQRIVSEDDLVELEIPEIFVSDCNEQQLGAIRQSLRNLPFLAERVNPNARHPWGFIESVPAGFNLDEVQACAERFDQALQRVVDSGVTVGELQSASAADLQTWANLLREPRYPLATLDEIHRGNQYSDFKDLGDRAKSISSASEAWRTVVAPTFLDSTVAEWHAAAIEADESGFFGRKKRRRAVLARFNEHLLVADTDVKLKELSVLTAAMVHSQQRVAALRSQIGAHQQLQEHNRLDPYDPDTLESFLDYIAKVSDRARAVNPDQVDATLLAAMRKSFANGATSSEDLAALADALAAFQELLAPCGQNLDRWAHQSGFFTTWWDTRANRRLSAQQPSTLALYVEFLGALEPFAQARLTRARQQLLEGEVPADDGLLAFNKGLASASVAERIDATGLDRFNKEKHEQQIERLSDASDRVRLKLPFVIPSQIVERRRFRADSTKGKVGDLRRQLERRRGGMKVPALLANFGDLITQLTPCTMMSPESVARFLPAQAGLFDIAVFDEASQIRVADSIGAMGRAESVVIVGDSKQMPPTSFGESSAPDELVDDSELVTFDEESILSECVQAQIDRRWLTWHYRSEDESLISFSNDKYYEGRLSSFPTPRGLPEDSKTGLQFVPIAGHFIRSGKGASLRTNPEEAEAIVAFIIQRLQEAGDTFPSIGVVTFNAQQRALIENLLRETSDDRIAASLDDPDGVFVKNLENVQGDERDTILFSVAFSENDKGVVPLNFGPLSRSGGERRLNVAVTRARRQVVMFCSFKPSQLRTAETSSVGVRHLRDYLELAELGTGDSAQLPRRDGPVDPYRNELAAALQEAGLSVRTDVGLSDFRIDIVVADPERDDEDAVALLLDGPTWASRGSSSDRDQLPRAILQEKMNWPLVKRVWLPDWLNQPDRVVAEVHEALKEYRTRRDTAQTDDPSAETSVEITTESNVDRTPNDSISTELPTPVTNDEGVHGQRQFASSPVAPPPVFPVETPAEPLMEDHPRVEQWTPWPVAHLGGVETLDQLSSSRHARQQVAAAITAVIQTEGPVQKKRLAKLVCEGFQLKRVSASRAKAIFKCIPSEFRESDDSDFVWPTAIDPSTWRSARQCSPGERNLDEVSLFEIVNAMVIECDLSAGLESDDLLKYTLAFFGGKRQTTAIGQRLSEAQDQGLRLERLHYRHGVIQANVDFL